MQLESITLFRVGYGHDEGTYKGQVKYKGDNGSIEINILPEHVRPILAAVAESLVTSSKEVATQLTAEVITQSGLLLGND